MRISATKNNFCSATIWTVITGDLLYCILFCCTCATAITSQSAVQYNTFDEHASHPIRRWPHYVTCQRTSASNCVVLSLILYKLMWRALHVCRTLLKTMIIDVKTLTSFAMQCFRAAIYRPHSGKILTLLHELCCIPAVQLLQAADKRPTTDIATWKKLIRLRQRTFRFVLHCNC